MRELSGHLSNVVHRQTIRDAECVAREKTRAKVGRLLATGASGYAKETPAISLRFPRGLSAEAGTCCCETQSPGTCCCETQSL